MMTKARSKNSQTAILLFSIAGGMVGLAFASVPLYQLFCQVTGYGGTPTGREGERDLVQIGGAQNTFGRVGPCMGPDGDICMGQDPSLVLGVGQAPGGEVLASGHFSIPHAAGVYVFRLAGVRASCLVEANPPPFWSGVERARVWMDAPSISVVVP